MKRYVYETFNDFIALEGSQCNWIEAPNYREAKKMIKELCKQSKEIYPKFKVTFIAEVKYEDYSPNNL